MLVTRHRQKLKACADIMAIFPIWWSAVSRMMKGFFDKVMKMNFAYKSGEAGVQGLLGILLLVPRLPQLGT